MSTGGAAAVGDCDGTRFTSQSDQRTRVEMAYMHENIRPTLVGCFDEAVRQQVLLAAGTTEMKEK